MPTNPNKPHGSTPNAGKNPATAEEALARARRHARAAASETIATIHALLDAASLATTGEPSNVNELLRPIATLLDDVHFRLDGEREEGAASLLQAIAEALDSEITRWEERAQEDGEARAVLRAFLGLRELLWEFGVRYTPHPPEKSGPLAPRKTGRGSGKQRKRPRVQRVPVDS